MSFAPAPYERPLARPAIVLRRVVAMAAEAAGRRGLVQVGVSAYLPIAERFTARVIPTLRRTRSAVSAGRVEMLLRRAQSGKRHAL